jgi:hypothetical protein
MSFWTDKIQPVAPELPRADGQAYRAHRRQTSASGIYAEPTRPQGRPQIYDYTPPRTLSDYASQGPRSKWEQAPNQSDRDYTAKLKPYLQHLAETLPPAELERVAASYNAAITRLEGGQYSHTDLRRDLESRTSATGRGIMGTSTPQDRAAALGSRWGGREIEKPVGIGDSVGPAPQAVDLAAVHNAPVAFAQHTDVSGLRSTGSGFIGVDR